MNDLADLKWDDKPSNSQHSLTPNPPNYNISRQSTPNSAAHSGRSTPLSGFNSAGKSPSQDASAGKAAGDSFASLLPTKKNTGQLSMQERQKQLMEERARQAAEQQKRHEPFKLDDNQFWEDLGRSSGRSTPQTAKPVQTTSKNDDDILAAFNASAPVDSSSHFPPPSSSTSPQPTMEILDDDPFGLGQTPEAKSVPQVVAPSEEEDILGDLGRPVDEQRQRQPTPSSQGKSEEENNGPQDRVIAELVEMGFSVEKARMALDHTATGMDVQAAVGWLLSQAHEESRTRSESQGQVPTKEQPQDVLAEDRHGYLERKARTRRNDSSSPANADRDVTQRASEIGSSLFKTANSFWRQGQIRMQKAMADFQKEGESGQPRWLQESQHSRSGDKAPSKPGNPDPLSMEATDEALMLDMHKPAAPPRPPRSRDEPRSDEEHPIPQTRRPPHQIKQQTQELPSRAAARPVEKLNRRIVEEESAQAYVSPSRRRKPQAQSPQEEPKSTVAPESTVQLDIFSDQTAPAPVSPRPSSGPKASPPASSRKTVPPSKRPTAPARSIPQVSPTVLSQLNMHRSEGTAAFKRGDYASAHISYTSAITSLPANHPILAILHSNRALTSLKTGDPKTAVSDAETTLSIIGPSRGEGETISLGDGETDKPMKEFYGKAIMRKAEAFEHMEKWSDAAKAWREAVEAGVGGPISIQGRNRCEKAAGLASSTPSTTSGRPSPAPTSSESAKKPQPVRSAAKPRSAALDLKVPKESEAVTRLRAANAAAAAASDEAFALTDAVEARLSAWKDGKEGNLRALLASLDTVLWEGSGWIKVSMGDLIMANRCKVVYMKAIAKCHPDKIPPDASIEQRMISASVFATLNEAWDKFKIDNGL